MVKNSSRRKHYILKFTTIIKWYFYSSLSNVPIKSYSESHCEEFTWNLTYSLMRSTKKEKEKKKKKKEIQNLQPKEREKARLEISLRIAGKHSACQKSSSIKIISYKIMNLVFRYK